jgi:hypothetical protein
MQLPVLGNQDMERQVAVAKGISLADIGKVMATAMMSTKVRRRPIGMCFSERYEDEREDEQEQEQE